MNDYIDKLLALTLKERKRILKGIKAETRKHIFNSVYTMTQELGLDKVESFEERALRRAELIEQYPDTLFWDHAEVMVYGTGKHVRFPTVLISTNGDMLNYYGGRVLSLSKGADKKKAKYRALTYQDYNHQVHRIICSTFCSLPERLYGIPYGELYVNHIDANSLNDKASNLEWTTPSENTRHAFGNSLYKGGEYFQLEVMLDNGFLGRRFIITLKEIRELGLKTEEMRSKHRGVFNRKKYYHGMSVTALTFAEVGDKPVGFPEDIKEALFKNRKYFDEEVKPIIGTVQVGKNKGLRFSLFGAKDMRGYFKPLYINKAMMTGGSYCGCIFEYSTIREAIPLRGKLTDEVYNELMTHKRVYQ